MGIEPRLMVCIETSPLFKTASSPCALSSVIAPKIPARTNRYPFITLKECNTQSTANQQKRRARSRGCCSEAVPTVPVPDGLALAESDGAVAIRKSRNSRLCAKHDHSPLRDKGGPVRQGRSFRTTVEPNSESATSRSYNPKAQEQWNARLRQDPGGKALSLPFLLASLNGLLEAQRIGWVHRGRAVGRDQGRAKGRRGQQQGRGGDRKRISWFHAE
jgi:hypothetical protein